MNSKKCIAFLSDAFNVHTKDLIYEKLQLNMVKKTSL